MYSIGEFASIGRVSVRMLRHYDAIGLIVPARVDANTGYRHYDRTQLTLLGQVVSLRELGFSLAEIRVAVSVPQDSPVLRQLLMDRHAAISAELAADTRRLRRIEERLRLIEEGTEMTPSEITLAPLAAVRLAESTADIAELDPALIGPAVGPLFARLIGALSRAGAAPIGPAVAYYEVLDDETSATRAHAGFPVPPSVEATDEWSIVDLPAEDTAATLIHRGAMDTISDSWTTLRDWVTARDDLRPASAPREVYLNASPSDDQSTWVTQLQWPVDRL